jgi:hypothetical protein
MRKIIPLSLIFFFGVFHLCFGAMSSSNYKINSDVLAPGGWPSNSTNYSVGDTVGESVIGEGSSTNYTLGAGFWYGGRSLMCQSNDVYMVDYTLGDPNNYNKYLFSTSQSCIVVNNSSASWTLTISSTNMTSVKNNLTNSNIYIATDGAVGSGDTVTSATAPAQISAITEPGGPEYSLDSTRTIISGDASAQGQYSNQPTIKLRNLNSLYAETIQGTLTISLQ